MTKAEVTRTVDEYGFETLDVHTACGAHKGYVFFGPGKSDLALVNSSNGVGLGSSDYIRNLEDMARHVANVHRTVWLNDEEKAACLSFLEYIQQEAENFLTVRERFTVKIAKQFPAPGFVTYVFTSKEDALPTLHAKLTLSVDQPYIWGEDNAWRALYDGLNATKTRKWA